MLLYSNCDKPTRRFPFQTPSSITLALVATVAAVETTVVISLNSASLYIAFDGYGPMDFAGISTAAIEPPTAAAVAAVAAAAIVAILPAVFDARNLPADARGRYGTFHHPTDNVTK